MTIYRKYLIGCLAFLIFSGIFIPLINRAKADQDILYLDLTEEEIQNLDESVLTIQENTVVSNNSHYYEEVDTIYVVITAYSSTPGETDDTPFITASGSTVRDGIVAANFLPFGTEIKIPKLFGNKMFVVEDRMSPKKGYHIDIWFPSRPEALEFGAHLTYIEVVK